MGIRTTKLATAALGAALFLGACSPSTQADPQESETQPETAAPTEPSTSEPTEREGVLAHITATATNPGKPNMRVDADYGVEFGVGTIEPEAYLIALISDEGYKIGDLVTATFELRDEDDQILSSGHESKRFLTGNDLVFPMRMKLPEGIEAASAHVSIIIEAENREIPSRDERAEVEVGNTVLSTIDNKPVLAFNVENTSSLIVTKARMDVICYDEGDKIIGGGEAVPPNLEPHSKTGMHAVLVTTGDPDRCEIFPIVLQSQEPTKGSKTDKQENPETEKSEDSETDTK